MRISLKTLFSVVTYAVLFVVACVQGNNMWRVCLWYVDGLLILSTILTAVILQGRARAAAFGFALLSAVHVSVLMLFTAASPVPDMIAAWAPDSVLRLLNVTSSKSASQGFTGNQQ